MYQDKLIYIQAYKCPLGDGAGEKPPSRDNHRRWPPIFPSNLTSGPSAHDDVPVIAIELQSEAQLKDVTRVLLKAEINIHYVYPFLFRPNGRYGLVVRTEAQELAASVLSSHGITVLGRNDIAR